MAKRSQISPLGAAGLMLGSFVAGVLAERGARVSHKAEARVRKEIKSAGKAIEARTGKGRARRNPAKITPQGQSFREEVMDAFFQNSRISEQSVERGIFTLTFDVYESLDSYEAGTPLSQGHRMDEPEIWETLEPGNIVEVFVQDPKDPNAKLSEKDIVTIELTGESPEEAALVAQHAAAEHGKAERSHRTNKAPAKRARSKK